LLFDRPEATHHGSDLPGGVDVNLANIPWWKPLHHLDDAPQGDHDEELHVTDEGWLSGARVVVLPSVRHSALTSAGPMGICWHWTATNAPAATSLAKRLRKYDATKDRATSWHVLIARDGTLYQSVSFTRGAWHCAKGFVPDLDDKMHRVNKSLVGIELENAGELRKLESGYFMWPHTERRENLVAKERVMGYRGKFYENFVEAQMHAAQRLMVALMDWQLEAFTPQRCMWGHVDFDPTRKIDPGPIWRSRIGTIAGLAYDEACRSSGATRAPTRLSTPQIDV